MSGDFDGLVAHGHRWRLRHRGRHAAELLAAGPGSPCSICRPTGRSRSVAGRLRRRRRRVGPGRGRRAWWSVRPARHRGQQRRHRRAGHGGGQPRRRVAPGPRHQRGRHGPGEPRGAAAPARVGGRRDGQHLLGRGDGGSAAARALQRDQGRRALAHPGDGRRPPARGDPGELRQPRHRRHPVGGSAAREPPTRRPSGRRWRRASRTAGWSARRRWPAPSRTSPARAPVRPPAPRSPSTGACRPCGCARRDSEPGPSTPVGRSTSSSAQVQDRAVDARCGAEGAAGDRAESSLEAACRAHGRPTNAVPPSAAAPDRARSPRFARLRTGSGCCDAERRVGHHPYRSSGTAEVRASISTTRTSRPVRDRATARLRRGGPRRRSPGAGAGQRHGQRAVAGPSRPPAHRAGCQPPRPRVRPSQDEGGTSPRPPPTWKPPCRSSWSRPRAGRSRPTDFR